MWTEHVILSLVAFCAGVGVSAGTFAFILVIGVIPRIMQKTNLANKTSLMENMIIAGGIVGCVISSIPALHLCSPFGHVILVIYGISSGIFVGCISVALAEILNTFPILFRRLRMKQGLKWVMLAMAAGKFAGAITYFINGFGA